MTTPFETVKQYLQQLPVTVVSEDADDQLVVVEAPRQGVHHLVLDCEDDILVIEQVIADLPAADADCYRTLLQINRELVHGALCLDEAGTRLIFRDTLQLENLDLNELEGSINALSLMLAEHADQLIRYARQGGEVA
ncbi:MAG: YbjN domain-containing protein [Pseudomonadales bacterium]|uniref:YbjN domain-containing protein n=1 Tax=Marinobacter xestospongiae TaxID=994319 RepID=UPI002005F330|nr:YbjN domain-containing protein [Marinobacter xestospongiae]MCG8520270.1 YbjN domain-containing protein [Pseudomonadales bacterium]MCK7567967.1 YbjN domain-containing protein [Marinobacter xestospongiae]